MSAFEQQFPEGQTSSRQANYKLKIRFKETDSVNDSPQSAL